MTDPSVLAGLREARITDMWKAGEAVRPNLSRLDEAGMREILFAELKANGFDSPEFFFKKHENLSDNLAEQYKIAHAALSAMSRAVSVALEGGEDLHNATEAMRRSFIEQFAGTGKEPPGRMVIHAALKAAFPIAIPKPSAALRDGWVMEIVEPILRNLYGEAKAIAENGTDFGSTTRAAYGNRASAFGTALTEIRKAVNASAPPVPADGWRGIRSKAFDDCINFIAAKMVAEGDETGQLFDCVVVLETMKSPPPQPAKDEGGR